MPLCPLRSGIKLRSKLDLVVELFLLGERLYRLPYGRLFLLRRWLRDHADEILVGRRRKLRRLLASSSNPEIAKLDDGELRPQLFSEARLHLLAFKLDDRGARTTQPLHHVDPVRQPFPRDARPGGRVRERED